MSVLLSWMVACSGGPAGDGDGAEEPPPEPIPAKILHRLNRAELDNTFRDLLGTTEIAPSEALPTDESTDGLDNMAASLSVSVSHLAGLEIAVDEALDEFFGRDLEETVEYPPVLGTDPGVQYFGAGRVVQGVYVLEDGSIEIVQPVEYDGRFAVEARMYAVPAEVTPAVVDMAIDNRVVSTTEVDWQRDPDAPGVTTEVTLEPGLHRLSWTLTNPDDVNLGFIGVQVIGPLEPRTGPTDRYTDLVDCVPETDATCAERVLTTFVTRAWRRPPSDDDLAFVLGAYDTAIGEGLDGSRALQHAMKVVMLDARFLYRFEQDPEGLFGRLSSFELASRMSFFLWSSMPDDALLDAAGADALADDAGVLDEADRMLSNIRSEALIDNFAGQWMDLRRLAEVQPSVVVYPEFDEALRTSMIGELRLLAEDFFRGRISLDAMLTNQDRWIDERLARHYGEPWPTGDDGWVQAVVTGSRPGLLGSAGWLTLTSNPDSPNTVSRGKWVLEHLICASPPPPPPDVEATPIEPEPGSSVREQEEALRSAASCQGCHQLMDPIGFVAGNFGGTGQTRTVDELGYAIDTTAEVHGRTMSQLAEVAEWASIDERLPRCFAEKVFAYAVGRLPTEADETALTDITEQFVDGGLTFPPLARAIVTSRPFVHRSAPDASEAK
ncbi:MAG: DUF1592 domain-containing protein [Myxococcota bacterium]